MATKTLAQMREEYAALEQKITQAEQEGRASAIEQIHAIMDEFSLTPEDLVRKRKRGPNKNAGTPIPPKYQDPKSGATWSGRGKAPAWIGKNRDRFLIQK
ncbi:H-NS family nucleoid-associated regulatory protein [Paraburkholderia sp. BCC1886]|uniref:H-NS histone family protein n=1 Tax=Paraburkholderia sp. BCC1886 TaxID=2562670 RepID=UPI00118277DB|nr:H-NS histone family protein [Paraburkholderia sp. BCC1886]